ncbi:MAG: hypothetical protein A2583_03995 [Bdellovibrionales bacterium RIFOXYD1_FULL_53_11]|nr:MAG: hypothetical protein A2583_03995 [Bdellovibrionales bacterium RIFOXYD1_FULL_53_11]
MWNLGLEYGLKNISLRRVALFAALAIGVLLIEATSVEAAGRKKPAGPSTPMPIRYVVLDEIGTTPFYMPNGKDEKASFGADLKLLLKDAVKDTGVLSVTDSSSSKICEKYLMLTAGVSIFELKIASVGITVGYSHSSDANKWALSKLEGELDVEIGNILMDFGIWECTGPGVCQQIVNSDSSHLLANVNLSVKINFSELEIGPDFIWKSEIGNIIKKVMEKGIMRMAGSDRFTKVPWRAYIMQDFDPNWPGFAYMNAGAQQGVRMNQMFEVLTVTPSEGECAAYRVAAYGHTRMVNAVSSVLAVEPSCAAGAATIKKGDIVMVHDVSLGSNSCVRKQ